jgi:acyl carrier protein
MSEITPLKDYQAFKIIRDRVSEHLSVDVDTITEDSDFIDDLGADSLDIVELTMIFEETFQHQITDFEVEKLRTVGDAVRLIVNSNSASHVVVTTYPAAHTLDPTDEQINETVVRTREIVAQCEFENYTFLVTPDRDGAKIQATYPEADIITGEIETQYTRKWLVSPFAVKSEIVKTLFKCCATSTEHRLRENFKYRERRIFGPHLDVDAMWDIARKVDVRNGHPE